MPLDEKEKLRLKMNVSRCEANIAEMTLKIMDEEERLQKVRDGIKKQEELKAEYLEKLGE